MDKFKPIAGTLPYGKAVITMATNTRFATGMHVLVLLARQPDSIRSSESLAAKLQTNAVVVRRILALLQEAGLVRNHKGPAGGSELLRPPAQITLADVYRALEAGPLFHDAGARTAEVRRTGAELRRALTAADTAFVKALAGVTLQQVARRTARGK